MNILYLHGLDSKLSEEKRKVLQKFGKVFSPDLNYYEDENAVETVLNYCSEITIDVVMGSSMGGFAGYYVSNALDKPALLFNPALVERSVAQKVPQISSVNILKHIVLGQVDEVVNPHDTLNYLRSHFNTRTHLHLHLVPGLGHNIPVPFFEEEVRMFLNRL